MHQRTSKETYTELVERFNKRLAGWKSKCLSLVWRITLARSVLNAMPILHMRTTKLPTLVSHDIDKITRHVWGSNEHRRSIHLVDWQNMSKPIKLGGVGLEQAEFVHEWFRIF